ncbi:MAG: sulfurtransferase TusA family protein [Thaumarchaeota archaeon]|nr:sulfurtransferase TusA family protein [Nitrososphaerota archaeon]MCS4539874.1 sulfurtransferase TusA family protein [Nitrososphaerota archaeon]
MSYDIWEHFIDMPQEINSEEVAIVEKDAILLDVRGEVCPYPQIETKKALEKLKEGQVLVVYTDHTDAVANVPPSVKGQVSKVRLWKSGKGEYKLFFWKSSA